MTRRAVSREQILDVADRIGREQGISHITSRRLCAALGITPPALYTHFSAMDLIIDEVVEGVIGRITLPGPEAGDWTQRLRMCWISMHDEVLPYPGLAIRMAVKPPLGRTWSINRDWIDNLLASAGLSKADADNVIYAVSIYIYGHLLLTEAGQPSGRAHLDGEASRGRFLWGFDSLLDSFRQRFNSQSQRTRRPRRVAATHP